MKILVPIKQVVDPNARIRIRADGTAVDTTGLRLIANPFDEIALEEALRLCEAGHASEVTVVSVGAPSVDDALRSALAMGADAAIRIDNPGALEPLGVARLLAALVRQRGYDLLLLGKQAIDDDCGQTGPMASALLGWPLATFASRLVAEGTSLVVTREVDSGLQTLRLDLPAAVTVDLRLNVPRFASLPSIMKARRMPIEIVAAPDLSDDLAPQLQVTAIAEPARRSSVRMVGSVPELVECLRTAGVL